MALPPKFRLSNAKLGLSLTYRESARELPKSPEALQEIEAEYKRLKDAILSFYASACALVFS